MAALSPCWIPFRLRRRNAVTAWHWTSSSPGTAEPRAGFTKATVSAWRVSLEERRLGSSSIIVRMFAIRKLAVKAMDSGLLASELAAGIQRVKCAESIGVRMESGSHRSRLRRC